MSIDLAILGEGDEKERDRLDEIRYLKDGDVKTTTVQNVSATNDDDIGSDNDEDSWITPNNYKQACEKMTGLSESSPSGIAVGCITTDFAMQNVMLQMGLNVISVDGMRVKQIRTYAMKCKACFNEDTVYTVSDLIVQRVRQAARKYFVEKAN